MVVMCHFFKKVEKKGDYIIYIDYIPEYISFQYNHLVITTWISLTKIKVKEGEQRIWKMIDSNHEHIMETCIPMTFCLDE